MTPLTTLGPYILAFDTMPELTSARYHFMTECGWTEAQFEEIEDFPFFTAEVTLWKDGEEVASDCLGACCYKTEAEFYTTYKGEYFAQMVREVAQGLGIDAEVEAYLKDTK